VIKFLGLFAAIIIAQFPGAAPTLAQGARAAPPISVEIKKRKIVSARTIRVKQGDQVQLNWKTDEKAVLHLHGYDIETNVARGKPASMKFTAKATGRFPVTSHGFGDGHGHSALIYIEVHPK
jgi:FtsP/CotA-like multicopper oxidase with cupredoxin domain